MIEQLCFTKYNQLMKLCVYQGTFNPIHNAHLNVAKYILENSVAENILFIPCSVPPHKDCDIEAKHRLNMVKLATEDEPNFEYTDIEFKRDGKSFTYQTILELNKIYNPTGKIKFIIGTDAFEKIETWYETDKLKKMVDFVVFIRENNFDPEKFIYLKEKGYNFEVMPMKFEDISSTTIRNLVKNNKDITKFVPKKVKEYIEKNELYKN